MDPLGVCATVASKPQPKKQHQQEELDTYRNFLCNYVNECINKSSQPGLADDAAPTVQVRKGSSQVEIVGKHELKINEIECEVLDWLVYHLEQK